jgi:hypothetical protein
MYDATALAELVDDDSITVPPGATSLAFLQAIYRSTEQPMVRRMKAAMAALPFEHPRLAVTAVINDQGIAAQLQRAIQRSAKVMLARQETAPIVDLAPTAQEVSTAAMHRPMALVRRR